MSETIIHTRTDRWSVNGGTGLALKFRCQRSFVVTAIVSHRSGAGVLPIDAARREESQHYCRCSGIESCNPVKKTKPRFLPVTGVLHSATPLHCASKIRYKFVKRNSLFYTKSIRGDVYQNDMSLHKQSKVGRISTQHF